MVAEGHWVRDRVRRFLASREPLDVDAAWAALEKATGEFLGWFHFRPGPDAPADEPELGYRLFSTAWNKGYATEGSRALVDRAFAGALTPF